MTESLIPDFQANYESEYLDPLFVPQSEDYLPIPSILHKDSHKLFITQEKIYKKHNEFKIEFKKQFIKRNTISSLMRLRDIPIDLETIETRRRSDDFVSRQIQEWLRRVDNQELEISRPTPRPAPTPFPNRELDPRKYFGSSTGLRASVVEASSSVAYAVNGEMISAENNTYTRVDFTPNGRMRFVRRKMTDSLASAIHGMLDLLQAVDQGTFAPAPVFVGNTNINMALIAQRLGFAIVDDCRTEDGAINKNLKKFTVVGRLEDIQTKVDEFKRAGVHNRLDQRIQRMSQRSAALAPA
jgi:hypothetical protein